MTAFFLFSLVLTGLLGYFIGWQRGHEAGSKLCDSKAEASYFRGRNEALSLLSERRQREHEATIVRPSNVIT